MCAKLQCKLQDIVLDLENRLLDPHFPEGMIVRVLQPENSPRHMEKQYQNFGQTPEV